MLTQYPEVKAVECQHFAFAVKTASSTVDCQGRSAAHTQGGTIPSLLLKDDLQSCAQVWAPQPHMDHAMLHSVQSRAPKRVKALAQHAQEDAGRTSTSWLERSAGRARVTSERHSKGHEAAVTRCKTGILLKYKDKFFHTEDNQALGKVVETEDIQTRLDLAVFRPRLNSPSRGSLRDSVAVATAVE